MPTGILLVLPKELTIKLSPRRLRNRFIYAQIFTDKHYEEMHHALVSRLKNKFKNIDSGLQGNFWIEISEAEETVTLDTFSTMSHAIKTTRPNSKLARLIIDYLTEFYSIDQHNKQEYIKAG